MKRILTIVFLAGLFLFWPYVDLLDAAVTRQDLSCDTLTGGGTDPWAVDRFVTGGATQDDSADNQDYEALEDGDSLLVWDYTNVRILRYVYDDDSAQAEDSPFYIAPDYTECVGSCTAYAGDGRWVLVTTVSKSFETAQDDVADAWKGYEQSSNGSNFMGFIVPNAITDDLLFRLTDTNPTADNVMLFAVPSSNESAQTWGSFTANDFDIAGGVISLDYTNGQKASDTQPGFLTELATITETNAGTDTARAVTPDSLAGSVYGEQNVSWCVFDNSTDVVTGDSDFSFVVPATLNGFELQDVTAAIDTQGGTSGATNVQIIRRRSGTPVNMLTTATTIEYNTYYANDETVNGANDDLQTGDQLYPNVAAIPSGGTPTGLTVTATFRKP